MYINFLLTWCVGSIIMFYNKCLRYIYELIAFAARKLFIIASEKIVNTYNVALENKTKLRNIPYSINWFLSVLWLNFFIRITELSRPRVN